MELFPSLEIDGERRSVESFRRTSLWLLSSLQDGVRVLWSLVANVTVFQFNLKRKWKLVNSSPVDIFLTFSDSVANTNRTLAISPIPLILRELVDEYQKKKMKKRIRYFRIRVFKTSIQFRISLQTSINYLRSRKIIFKLESQRCNERSVEAYGLFPSDLIIRPI